MSVNFVVPPLLTFLADASLKVALLAIASEALLRALRVCDAARSHLVWSVALLGMLLIGPMRLILPTFALTVRLPAMVSFETSAQPAIEGPQTPIDAVATANVATPTQNPRPEIAAPTAPERLGVNWQQLLGMVYLSGLALMIGRLLLGAALSHRLLRRADPLDDPGLSTVEERIRRTAGLSRTPQLFSSPAVRIPFAFGWLRPAIVLPDCWRCWDAEKLESVLAHETAHLRRADPWTHLLSLAVRCIYWFHPAAWLASRRLTELSEQACDSLAIRWTGRRKGYAQHLLEVAASLRGQTARVVLGALPMARISELNLRIEAILRLRSANRAARLASSLAALAVLCLVASLASVRIEPIASAAMAPPVKRNIASLTSTNAEERARAAIDLRRQERPTVEAIPNLVALLGDRAQLTAIVDDNDQPIWFRFATSKRTDPGTEAARTLGSFGNLAFEPLEKAARSGNAEVRLDATTALGLTRSDRAIEPLLARLADESAGVRRMAAWGLGSIGEPQAYEALSKATEDANARVREMASWARHQIDLRRPAAPGRRANANRPTAPRGVDHLLRDLHDPYFAVRVQAAQELGDSRDPRAALALRTALREDSDYRVRLATTRTLGSAATDADIEALRGALADSDYRVRLRASAELARKGVPAGLQELTAALRHEHHMVRMTAIDEIRQCGDPSAAKILLGALKDRDPRVRRKAAEALGSIGTSAAIDALRSALSDANGKVREAAKTAIAAIEAR